MAAETQLKTFEPEIELTDLERTELVQVTSLPGFKVIHKILRNQVDKLALHLINTPAGDKDEVYGRFLQSKTAAQIYQGASDRINAEIASYIASRGSGGVEGDSTESSLDIGEVASKVEDLPNLLGGDNVLEGTDE